MTPAPIKRFLREPLFHFVMLGVIVFAVNSYFSRDNGPMDSDKYIQLTPDELLQMTVYFQSKWQRPPDAEEFAHLLEMRIKEEVLYREALAMGLDKDDTIVKRRMAQKMQFISEDAAAREPDTDELRAWYAQNSRIFAMPGRISFRQIYFSPDRRGQHVREDAEAALAGLAGQSIDSPLVAETGDSIMLQDYFGDRSVESLAREFGPSFAQAVMKVEPDIWSGPIESGLGWHLVYVDSFEPGRVPDFSEVENEVKTAWLAEQKARGWEKAYAEMREKYTILLPAIPEEEASLEPGSAESDPAADNTQQ